MPSSFSFTEKDFDYAFIGQWEIHHIDDYGAIKAGTISRTSLVRSQVDSSRQVIRFISWLPTRNGVSDIFMNGSVGFFGKITEKIQIKDGDYCKSDFIHIKLLAADVIMSEHTESLDNYTVWKTTCEIDDLYYNSPSYPFYYFGKKSKLCGFVFELPLTDFNKYVHLRDLWYREYKGSKELLF